MKLYKLLGDPFFLSKSLSSSKNWWLFYLVLKALRLLWTYHIFSPNLFYSVSFSILTRAQNVEIQKLLTSFLKMHSVGSSFPRKQWIQNVLVYGRGERPRPPGNTVGKKSSANILKMSSSHCMDIQFSSGRLHLSKLWAVPLRSEIWGWELFLLFFFFFAI